MSLTLAGLAQTFSVTRGFVYFCKILIPSKKPDLPDLVFFRLTSPPFSCGPKITYSDKRVWIQTEIIGVRNIGKAHAYKVKVHHAWPRLFFEYKISPKHESVERTTKADSVLEIDFIRANEQIYISYVYGSQPPHSPEAPFEKIYIDSHDARKVDPPLAILSIVMKGLK